MTFPVAFEDHASSANFPTDGTMASMNFTDHGEKKDEVPNWDYTNYEEDIYVGYRYFDSFGKQVSYPFGHGLSYTTFEYRNPDIQTNNGTYTISVDIKNTGQVLAKEVVQLYVSAPDAANHNKPEKELKAFAKTKALNPGETTTVVLTVNAADLASFDESASSWKVDAGNYQFLVGASSRDIKATLEVAVAASEEKTQDLLKLQTGITLLKR
jgi:beta-glucosidase